MKILKLTVSLLIIGILSGCIGARHEEPVSRNALENKTDVTSLTKTIADIEQALGSPVGVSIYDAKTKTTWSHHGDRRFPLMSTFKTLACAKALRDIEAGALSFDDSVVIEKTSLVTWSPVTSNHVGQAFSLKQACESMMTMSDNTAANIVLTQTGGPQALTSFARSIGDTVTRLDRMEPDLNEARKGDLRDTTTPDAMAGNLRTLVLGNELSDASKALLTNWMRGNKVSGSLLRSVLPKGWDIADRSGAGGHGSRGIAAVVWPAPEEPLVVCIYLTQTTASFEELNKSIASIGRAIFALYQ
ncbi:beta-lactamase/transpeptidase-like [Desulfoluna butyratoxydans]|uniref:beta-lactamase n=1 Tax=Desulfoluna butyratoxydans TaxID=231438 RepID=A0A4U8YQ49_9BACT|nr:beta-lactamase/transpeptidase-like [Desulfoluna butyratoxydans]